jgi:hypothetical protein
LPPLNSARMIRMSGYFKTGWVVRTIAASVMGLVSVIAVVAITFLALAFVDAGADLSPFIAWGLLLGALFGAALVITRALTEPPRGSAAFFVGLGGCAGVALTEPLVWILGYPFTRQPDGMALCFVLSSLGAFLGTYGRVPLGKRLQ